MNKLTLCLLSTFFFATQAQHINNLDSLIKQLRLKTHRAEFTETPGLLQSIITELYIIQNEFQSLSLFTHQTLQNLSDASESFNTISEQISNIIPERRVSVTLTPKKNASNRTASLLRTVKKLEKYHTSLEKNMKDINTINKILQSTLEELETIQKSIYQLGTTVKQLALSYHHQAKDLFTIALKLFTLTGIESETGPYLCQEDQSYSQLEESL